MDKLPKGWKLHKFINIAQFIDYRGLTPNKSESGVPLITAKNVKKGFINVEPREYILESEYKIRMTRGLPQIGDLLFTTEAPLGNAAILNYDYKVAVGQRLITLHPINSVCISKFLLYTILSPQFQEKLESKSTGTTVKGIKSSILKQFEIPLPPLPEQTRIVNKLDSLFERIDKSIALLEENIKHTEALMASVLDEVFGEIEESLLKPILDVCSIYNKTINPKDGEIYNYVGLENIESVSGRLVDFSPSTGESIKSSKVIFGKNAVLYGKLRPYLNKVWVSDFEGVSTTEILPFKPNNKILDSNYLAYYLRSPKFVNLVNSNTSGARMPRATTGFFKTIAKVPVPELKVQERIVTKLNVLSEKSNKLITEQQSKLCYLKALKASLLDKVFKGEL